MSRFVVVVSILAASAATAFGAIPPKSSEFKQLFKGQDTTFCGPWCEPWPDRKILHPRNTQTLKDGCAPSPLLTKIGSWETKYCKQTCKDAAELCIGDGGTEDDAEEEESPEPEEEPTPEPEEEPTPEPEEEPTTDDDDDEAAPVAETTEDDEICNCPTRTMYLQAKKKSENCESKFHALGLSSSCESVCKTKTAWRTAGCVEVIVEAEPEEDETTDDDDDDDDDDDEEEETTDDSNALLCAAKCSMEPSFAMEKLAAMQAAMQQAVHSAATNRANLGTVADADESTNAATREVDAANAKLMLSRSEQAESETDLSTKRSASLEADATSSESEELAQNGRELKESTQERAESTQERAVELARIHRVANDRYVASINRPWYSRWGTNIRALDYTAAATQDFDASEHEVFQHRLGDSSGEEAGAAKTESEAAETESEAADAAAAVDAAAAEAAKISMGEAKTILDQKKGDTIQFKMRQKEQAEHLLRTTADDGKKAKLGMRLGKLRGAAFGIGKQAAVRAANIAVEQKVVSGAGVVLLEQMYC